MKVLFVCRANSGRSQIAMELYNQLHPGEAFSAGTMVNQPGQKLKYRKTAQIGIRVMKEVGIDMSENKRTQLVPEMLKNFDKVIVLAEPEAVPDYLHERSNVELHPIEDIRNKNHEEALRIREQIRQLVGKVSTSLHRSNHVLVH
jgi:protein-tyrosine-phosphatase